MRHRVVTKKMNRDTDHRKALLRNLSRSLILDGGVETTLAKARFFRPYVEKLVTRAKRGNSFANISVVNSKLRSKEAVRVLFDKLAKDYAKRDGGYTRIVKLGFRDGDKAKMARIEWVLPKTESKAAKNSSKINKASKASKKVTTQKKETKDEDN